MPPVDRARRQVVPREERGRSAAGKRRASRKERHTLRAERVASPSEAPRRTPPATPAKRRASREPTRRRARSMPGTVLLTVIAALIPGSGYLYAGRKALGVVILGAWVGAIGATGWYFGRDLRAALDFAFDPTRLQLAAIALTTAGLIWVFVVVTSHRLIRPARRRRWQTLAGNVVALSMCAVVLAPMAVAARYAVVQADLVTTVFEDNTSATAPKTVTAEDPWGGTGRVNVLLLGGDGGEGRTGVRTDTVIVLSMNTRTGKDVTFSLPRNLRDAEFPEDSPLRDLYPEGYDGEGDEGFYMLNAIYGQIPTLHPGILGKSDNEGADAVKQAVSGSLGIDIDYYMLVNLAGFREVVDAIGGVTVNINERVAIEGNTDAGIPPVDWLEPGPEQDLDGFEALWFSRGRYGSDDYERMERQRCMVDAIIEAADPMTLVRRYQSLAKVGKEIVSTDIPRKLVPAFLDLAMKVKQYRIKSVVFENSDKFYTGDPDFDYARKVVDEALAAPKNKTVKPKRSPGQEATGEAEAADEIQTPVEAEDACAYAPSDEVSAAP